MATIIADRITDPSVDDLTVTPNGKVRVRDWSEHPLHGHIIGWISRHGTPVWIDQDGYGGSADTEKHALEGLLDNALTDYIRAGELRASEDDGFED